VTGATIVAGKNTNTRFSIADPISARRHHKDLDMKKTDSKLNLAQRAYALAVTHG